MNNIIEEAKAFAREIFAGDASGHDFDHTMRVFRMATRIAETEGADILTVQLAALLHDVDDRKLSPETSEEKLRAAEFLRSHHVEGERISGILHIIDTISFSAGKGAPESIEGKCVQDADRLDAMGAIGIARTFAYGGSRGRAIHDSAGEDKTTSIQHFYDKLLLLRDRMNTESGREIAQQRHAFMQEFLNRFYDEWEGES